MNIILELYRDLQQQINIYNCRNSRKCIFKKENRKSKHKKTIQKIYTSGALQQLALIKRDHFVFLEGLVDIL